MKLIGTNTGTSRAATFDNSGNITASSVTTTELNYLSGVTSSVQSQINNHKYHVFSNGQYFYDGYAQSNYLRMFTENATFDTARFATISSLQYYNGTAWQDWSSNINEIQKLLDGREDTSTTIDHTHKNFRFTFTRTSSWPSMCLVVLQSYWTGITYPSITLTIEHSNDGGATWALKETCNFDTAHSGSDYGIHLKATSNLNDGYALCRVNIQIADWTDSGSYTTIPLRRFMILSNYGGRSLQPWSWGYNKVVNFEATPTALGYTIWHQGNDGAGSGLDADLLDGMQSGNSSGQIPISNGTLCTNLNAEKIGSYTAAALTKNAGTDNSVIVTDNRNTNFNPQDRGQGLFLDFMRNVTDSLDDGGTFHGLMTFRQFGTSTDWTGGTAKQLGFTDNGNLWMRQSTGSTTWGSWSKFWHQNNDGTGSGLDADLLRGMSPVSTNTVSTVVARDASGNFSAGTITAALAGNASTATKLATSRTISLTGDVTGSATFDGSANSTITAVVADDSHNHVISNIDNLQSTLDAKTPFQTMAATTAATAGWYRIATSAINIGANSALFKVDFSGTGVKGSVLFRASCHDGIANGTGINQLGFTTTAGTLGLTQCRVVYNTTATGNYAYIEIYNPTALAITYTVDLIDSTGWTLITPGTIGSIPSGYTSEGLTFDTGFVSAEDVTAIRQLKSNIATGTPPLVVASTTKVANLNVEKLDDMDATSSNTPSTVVSRDASGNFSAGTVSAALNGNANTATKFATARKINGVNFDGTADITIPASTTNIARGTGTFLSNSTEVAINHGLASIPVAVTVTPIAATSAGTNGTVGEIWTRFDATKIYVGNTGSSTCNFSWIAMI